MVNTEKKLPKGAVKRPPFFIYNALLVGGNMLDIAYKGCPLAETLS
jgi:hypothetical protein